MYSTEIVPAALVVPALPEPTGLVGWEGSSLSVPSGVSAKKIVTYSPGTGLPNWSLSVATTCMSVELTVTLLLAGVSTIESTSSGSAVATNETVVVPPPEIAASSSSESVPLVVPRRHDSQAAIPSAPV